MINIRYRRYQKEVVRLLNSQFKIMAWPKGRRYGGTHIAMTENIRWMNEGSANSNPQKHLWGDTVQSNIDRYVLLFAFPILNQVPKKYWSWNSQKKLLRLYDSHCDFRSEDRPFNWEGFGYDVTFINEAGIVLRNKYLWENTILPMTFDNPNSKVILVGKPLGKMWKGEEHAFYQMDQRATEQEDILDQIPPNERIIRFHCTSYDNDHINRKEIEFMESNMDPVTAQQEIYAEFVDRTGMLAIYCFDESLHVGETIEHKSDEPLFLSFDFNVNPATCLISKHGHKEKDGKKIPYIHFIDEVCLSQDQVRTDKTHIETVCEIINTKWDGYYWVTGDSTGKAGHVTLKPKQNAWTEVVKHLGISKNQLKLRRNPTHEESLRQCNVMYSAHDRVEIRINPRCKKFIADLKGIKTDETGQIDKKESSMSHLFDCGRYTLWNFFGGFVKNL